MHPASWSVIPSRALWIQICQKWRNFPRLTIEEEKLLEVNLLKLAAASRALKDVFGAFFFFNQLEEVYRSQGDLLLAPERSRDKNHDCYSSWHYNMDSLFRDVLCCFVINANMPVHVWMCPKALLNDHKAPKFFCFFLVHLDHDNINSIQSILLYI